MSQFIDLTGKKFGRWRVLKNAGGNSSMWVCRCSCKAKTVRSIYRGNLTAGLSKSCGCLMREQARERLLKHGHSKERGGAYWTWLTMRKRCNSPYTSGYSNYGGRDIKVCKRWDSFENFLADMGERPPGKTIDRINHNGDYTPKNCKWSTPKEQARNRRVKLMLGKENVRQFMKRTGLSKSVVQRRLHQGMTPKQIEQVPVRRWGTKIGKETVAQVAKRLKISATTAYRRLGRGTLTRERI